MQCFAPLLLPGFIYCVAHTFSQLPRTFICRLLVLACLSLRFLSTALQGRQEGRRPGRQGRKEDKGRWRAPCHIHG